METSRANPEISFPLLMLALSISVIILFGTSLLIGPLVVGITDAMYGLFSDSQMPLALIMQEIRLPRAILGAVIGATLGLSGAVMQGLLRNPLAEPGLLGVSASASLGAVLAIYTGFSAVFPLGLPVAALTGAVLAVLLILAIAGMSGGVLTIILAGIAVSSFAGAMTSLALNLSPNPFAALEIVFWMLGSLNDRSMLHVQLAVPFVLIGWVMLLSVGRALDLLTLGEDVAASSGVNMKRVRFLAVMGTATSVGAATAVAGAIGFVGLIVPHILRPLVGARPSRLLPASALGGALLLLAADIAVRVIAPDRDLKIGVLTAIIGAPFFLWFVLNHRRSLL
ncbi:MAG: iron ABC transporter permease [Rhizobiaceae bacterium]|nr:iron ABC transporter permease [Rhizobiaceae bacterium]